MNATSLPSSGNQTERLVGRQLLETGSADASPSVHRQNHRISAEGLIILKESKGMLQPQAIETFFQFGKQALMFFPEWLQDKSFRNGFLLQLKNFLPEQHRPHSLFRR